MTATEAVDFEAVLGRFAKFENDLVALPLRLGLPSCFPDLGHCQTADAQLRLLIFEIVGVLQVDEIETGLC